jgi:serine/threonine protein kinase
MTRQRRNPIDDLREPSDLFRSIKSKIAQRGDAVADDGITVDLIPGVGETVQDTYAPPQAPASAAGLNIGEVIRGRYVIESQLASGGTGTVYEALDRARAELAETNAHVAIKVLHERSASAQVLSKLRREFFCVQALSHQNIAKVFELELDGEFPFFTMELIDGETLLALMQKFHPLPLPRAYALAVISEVGAGLVHAHGRRVIHGDLKPQNVMVNAGELRILDFGRSGESASSVTPAYASCELLEGRAPDPRDDLFALACLSYELLAGEHPFQHRRSTEARTLKMTPHRPPGLSGRKWRALKKGLAWDRADRPKSVREWLAEFGAGSDPLGPVPLVRDSQSLPIAKGHRKSVLIALLATIFVCGITWAVLSRPKVPGVAIEAIDPDAEVAASTALNVERALAGMDTDESEPPPAPAPSKADVRNRTAAPGAARPIDRTEKISVASASYPIGAGQKFAEIRVHRSAGSKGDTSFEWWTESGSALAGNDFAPQAPTTTFFPPGAHTVSLFIKVVPDAARKRPAVFYVVLGNPSSGTLLGAVSKAAVSLHP